MAQALALARETEEKAEGITKTAPAGTVETAALPGSEESDPPTLVTASTSDNIFRRTPKGWTLRYAGEEVLEIPDLRGMAVIQSLLRKPSQPNSEPVPCRPGRYGVVPRPLLPDASRRGRARDVLPRVARRALRR